MQGRSHANVHPPHESECEGVLKCEVPREDACCIEVVMEGGMG